MCEPSLFLCLCVYAGFCPARTRILFAPLLAVRVRGFFDLRAHEFSPSLILAVRVRGFLPCVHTDLKPVLACTRVLLCVYLAVVLRVWLYYSACTRIPSNVLLFELITWSTVVTRRSNAVCVYTWELQTRFLWFLPEIFKKNLFNLHFSLS